MKFCWFTTGRDKEAFALLKDVYGAMEEDTIGGEIAVVFMNRERGESPASDEIIAFAKAKGIPLELLSSDRFFKEQGLKPAEGRALFDARVKAKIEEYDFDAIFLAGYMLILSPILLESFRVFSLHPSLPNSYKGKREDVITRTIKDGKRIFGAMIHRVDASFLEGPPISFVNLVLEGRGFEEFYNNVFRGDMTSFDHLFKFMMEAESAAEAPLVIETLSSLSKKVIDIQNGKVCHSGQPAQGGVDMTDLVLSALRTKCGLSTVE
jgi:folate-dependent phosphoribosylglycinamide formyltransferase PurN